MGERAINRRRAMRWHSKRKAVVTGVRRARMRFRQQAGRQETMRSRALQEVKVVRGRRTTKCDEEPR